ncbi:MAG: hypothetical protein K2M82_04620 [Lachnospiraceae bacterium]|nr:hypothetical protein [Lachnospiraceae bacterium]
MVNNPDLKKYLINFGAVDSGWLPTRFIASDGYQNTPNQRTELQAFRDADIDMHRVTSPNYKTTVTLTLCPMSYSDKLQIQAMIENATIISTERKVRIKYWNDEENDWKTGLFYMPDVTYTLMGYYGGEPWYKSVTYEFIEY